MTLTMYNKTYELVKQEEDDENIYLIYDQAKKTNICLINKNDVTLKTIIDAIDYYEEYGLIYTEDFYIFSNWVKKTETNNSIIEAKKILKIDGLMIDTISYSLDPDYEIVFYSIFKEYSTIDRMASLFYKKASIISICCPIVHSYENVFDKLCEKIKKIASYELK